MLVRYRACSVCMQHKAHHLPSFPSCFKFPSCWSRHQHCDDFFPRPPQRSSPEQGLNVGGSQVAEDSRVPSPQKWRRMREERRGRAWVGKGPPRARTCSKTWSLFWRLHLPCWDCTCLDHRSLDRKLEIVSPCTLLSLQCVATRVYRSVGRLQYGPTPLPT